MVTLKESMIQQAAKKVKGIFGKLENEKEKEKKRRKGKRSNKISPSSSFGSDISQQTKKHGSETFEMFAVAAEPETENCTENKHSDQTGEEDCFMDVELAVRPLIYDQIPEAMEVDESETLSVMDHQNADAMIVETNAIIDEQDSNEDTSGCSLSMPENDVSQGHSTFFSEETYTTEILSNGSEQTSQNQTPVKPYYHTEDSAETLSNGTEQTSHDQAPVKPYNLTEDSAEILTNGSESTSQDQSPVKPYNLTEDSAEILTNGSEPTSQDQSPVKPYNPTENSAEILTNDPEPTSQEQTPVKPYNLTEERSRSNGEDLEKFNQPDKDRDGKKVIITKTVILNSDESTKRTKRSRKNEDSDRGPGVKKKKFEIVNVRNKNQKPRKYRRIRRGNPVGERDCSNIPRTTKRDTKQKIKQDQTKVIDSVVLAEDKNGIKGVIHSNQQDVETRSDANHNIERRPPDKILRDGAIPKASTNNRIPQKSHPDKDTRQKLLFLMAFYGALMYTFLTSSFAVKCISVMSISGTGMCLYYFMNARSATERQTDDPIIVHDTRKPSSNRNGATAPPQTDQYLASKVHRWLYNEIYHYIPLRSDVYQQFRNFLSIYLSPAELGECENVITYLNKLESKGIISIGSYTALHEMRHHGQHQHIIDVINEPLKFYLEANRVPVNQFCTMN